MEQEEDNWMPLESNPEVINSFIKDLGFDVSKYSLVDVLSTEEWAQEMVPQPVLAVFFLFPISEKQITFETEQVEKFKTCPQTISPNVYFMKQYAGNACGTIAAFHAIANAATTNQDLIGKGSYFEKYLENTKKLDYIERGNYFKKDKTLQEAHTKAVHEGATEVQEEVNTHFIAFVEVEGSLYELDGRKAQPINHGACQSGELLSKACGVIQQFMERDPGEIRFTIMALANSNA